MVCNLRFPYNLCTGTCSACNIFRFRLSIRYSQISRSSGRSPYYSPGTAPGRGTRTPETRLRSIPKRKSVKESWKKYLSIIIFLKSNKLSIDKTKRQGPKRTRPIARASKYGGKYGGKNLWLFHLMKVKFYTKQKYCAILCSK